VHRDDPGKMERWMLERGIATDAWIDLALRPDGTPVAVWFSHAIKGLKMYVGSALNPSAGVAPVKKALPSTSEGVDGGVSNPKSSKEKGT